MSDDGQRREQPDGASADDDRDESSQERLDRNWDELLQEIRVVQTGIQVLSGFLLTLPFTQVFADLRPGQRTLYLTLVVLGGLAVGTNLAPVMLHRRVFRDHVKERVVNVGQITSQIVIWMVATLITGTATLIFWVVISGPAGVLAAVGMGGALTVLLGLVPARLDPR